VRAPEEGAIRLLRCVDTACDEEPHVVFLDFVGYPEPIDMAVRADGRPIVIAQSSDFLTAAMYDCEDRNCTAAAFSEFVDAEPCIQSDGSTCSRASFPQTALGSDGLPRVVY
jgi:hypothetical protein